MMKSVSILGLLLVAVTMGLALAHALELPGKFRLDRNTYVAVQGIYYPGFTIGGLIGEFGGLVVLLVLLFMVPFGTERFWWTAAAFGFLVSGHAVYWLVTHPVNNFWVKDIDMSGAGAAFFSLLSARDGAAGDWTQMRAVWEYSHVARACLAMASLVSMAIALTL
jgi:hypothetical protein